MYPVEHARGRDRNALLELLFKAFRNKNPTHPRFEELYPEMFRATDAAMGRHLVIRENGVPVSCVGLYPVSFRMGRALVRAAGLGQVATDPEHGGKGMMHALMTRTMENLHAGEVSLGWLGGRHDRYSKYGWEWGGAGLRISMDAKSVGASPAGWTVREWAGTDSGYDRLWTLREAHPVRGLCSKAEWRLRIRRGKSQTWLAGKGKRAAFAVFNPGWRSLQEWGGEPDGLLALLAKLAESGGLSLLVQPELDPLADFFRDKAAGAAPWLAMLTVADLKAVASDYAPLLQTRMPAGRSLRLAVSDGERILSAATLGRADGKTPEIRLDRRRMTSFLFGPCRASQAAGVPDGLRWVDQIFPLPFMAPALFSV